MPLLIEFVFRLSFGLALAMATVPHALVTSGFFRNHLYVLLGLNVLATLGVVSGTETTALWLPLTASLVSYAGVVAWLYERAVAGKAALLTIAALDLIATWSRPPLASDGWDLASTLRFVDPATSGLLLGSTIAAMFLGHWYLNTPTMALRPLERLLTLMAVATALRASVAAAGLIALASYENSLSLNMPLVVLRWLAGVVGMAAVTWMARETLKIPNTQSATGILYVGVILTFLGELVSLLLSDGSPFPV
jgi:hypothetical protein